MLMRRPGVAVTYMIFDLLSLDGLNLTGAPYSERRAQLEALDLNGLHWQTPEVFEDGAALFEAVCAHKLEGVVSKRRRSRYRPGEQERGWVKVKNRAYWRYEVERESAISKRRPTSHSRKHRCIGAAASCSVAEARRARTTRPTS